MWVSELVLVLVLLWGCLRARVNMQGAFCIVCFQDRGWPSGLHLQYSCLPEMKCQRCLRTSSVTLYVACGFGNVNFTAFVAGRHLIPSGYCGGSCRHDCPAAAGKVP